VVLPAYRVFHQGRPTTAVGGSHIRLDTYGFATAKPGTRLYVSNASEARTYTATVGPKGELQNLKVFAERGAKVWCRRIRPRLRRQRPGLSLWPNAEALGVIDVPGRPLQLLLGGTNQQTLFILTHHALYSVNVGR